MVAGLGPTLGQEGEQPGRHLPALDAPALDQRGLGVVQGGARQDHALRRGQFEAVVDFGQDIGHSHVQ